MSPLAVILILVSAFMHAGWNLFSKHNRPTASFFLLSSLTGAVLLSPLAFFCREFMLRDFPPRVWLMLVATGFFMALYFAALAASYRAGDISVAYPLARSSPVIVVTVVTLLLGRGHQVSAMCVSGIVLVVAGCFLIPLRRFDDFRPGNYLNRTCLMALLAALGTAGYSIIDDEALRLLRAASPRTIGNARVTLLYAGLEAMSAALWLALFVVLRRDGRKNWRQVMAGNAGQAVMAGIAIIATYSLVLVSLAFVENVSYVVGFRQLSIPLGALMGIVALKEQPYRPKLTGVAIMFAGLLLIALG